MAIICRDGPDIKLAGYPAAGYPALVKSRISGKTGYLAGYPAGYPAKKYFILVNFSEKFSEKNIDEIIVHEKKQKIFYEPRV